MTTDTAHATDARVAPPTPDDYERLREYLDAVGLWANQPWPCVLFLEYDGSAPGPAAQAERQRDLRAAWWTRRTAPRREAHADSAADKELVEAGRRGPVAGWNWFGAVWHHSSTRDDDGVAGLTSRQLRARLAFDGATRREVRDIGFWIPRWSSTQESDYLRVTYQVAIACRWCHGTSVVNALDADDPRALPVVCSRCRRSAITVYPAAVVEAVPQADPAHGVEPCGCEHRGPYRHEIERFILVHNPYSAAGYTELRHDPGCQWCDGGGTVIDGRDHDDHDYDPGDHSPFWPYTNGPLPTSPEAARLELAYRREQPDAFGHGDLPTDIGQCPSCHWTKAGWAILNRTPDGDCATCGGAPPRTLARAPLAELLHERDLPIVWATEYPGYFRESAQ